MANFIARFLAGLALLMVPACAESFDLWAVNITNAHRARVWFGDGKAYVGPAVPPEVLAAFNVTAPGERADLLYLATDMVSNPGAPQLPEPTFLAARMSVNATDAVFLAHSDTNLPKTDNYLWADFQGYLIPREPTNLVGGGFYLFPTSLQGTWSLRFITNDDTAKQLGAIRTHLSTRGP